MASRRTPKPPRPPPAAAEQGGMSEAGFWTAIDETGGAYEPLVDRLAALPVEAIVAFDDHVGRLLHQSYQGDLWCAAYVAMGGCSDDGFDYFRSWLISRGRATFEAALRDPDSLCDALSELREAGGGAIPQDEDLLAAAARAHERKTGSRTFYDLARTPRPPLPALELRWDPDDEDSLRAVCPRIFAAFWDDPF